MKESITEIIKTCDRHADRLHWAMTQLQSHIPFSEHTLKNINDIELAILDQFSTRFGKLQDLMGAKLFPVVLEITKEPGELKAFIDKLYRLEKIGAIEKNPVIGIRKLQENLAVRFVVMIREVVS